MDIYQFVMVDTETRSNVDLPTAGTEKYCDHESTQILCLAYKYANGPAGIWSFDQPFPDHLKDHFERGKKASIHAHNSNFDRQIICKVLPRQVSFNPPPLEAFYDTMTQALARNLPAGLDDLARALQLPIQKDKTGKDLISKLCKPSYDRESGKPYVREDPDLPEALFNYCLTDVETAYLAARCTPPLTGAFDAS